MIQNVNKYHIYEILSSDGNFYYTIPKYQREYTWGINDWDALFNDVTDNEFGYFLGSYICVNSGSLNGTILEVIDGQQRFSVQTLQRALLEHLGKEHGAKGGGKLIDQSTDTQIFIVDAGLIGVEYSAYLQSNLGILIRTGKLLHGGDNGTDTYHTLEIELALHVVHDGAGNGVNGFAVCVVLQLLDQNDIRLAYADNVIPGLVGEHILNDVVGHDIGLGLEADQEHRTVGLVIEAKLLGLDVNIAGEDVIKNDVLDKVGLIVLLIVKGLDVREGDGKEGGNALGIVVLTLHEYDVLNAGVGADGTVSIALCGNGVKVVRDLLDDIPMAFTDAGQLAASNDGTLFVNDTNVAVNRLAHLIDQILEQLIAHVSYSLA